MNKLITVVCKEAQNTKGGWTFCCNEDQLVDLVVLPSGTVYKRAYRVDGEAYWNRDTIFYYVTRDVLKPTSISFILDGE